MVKVKKVKSSGWKPISKSILKKSPTATVTYTGSKPHYHFRDDFKQDNVSWLRGGI